jgi:hypothetical protein
MLFFDFFVFVKKDLKNKYNDRKDDYMMNKHLFVLDPGVSLAIQTALRTIIEDPSDVVRWISSYENMHLIAAMSRGKSKVVPIDSTIDFDTPEFKALNWEVAPLQFQLPNRLSGKIVFDLADFRLIDSSTFGWKKPDDDEPRAGADYSVRRALNYLAMNKIPRSHVIGFFLDHSYLLPIEWQPYWVVIVGTRYIDGEREYLLGLHHDGKSWDWGPVYLDDVVSDKIRFLIYDPKK